MKKILLDNPMHPKALAQLEANAAVLPLYRAPLAELRQALGNVNAAIVSTRFPITRDDIQSAPRLEVVGRPGAGVDSVDVRAATDAGVAVVYTPDAPTESVVEHALCFMLMLAKGMRLADEAVRRADFAFRTRAHGYELKGKTLGIIGGGHIGSRLAQVCSTAFDMHVLVYDPYLSTDQLRACGAELCPELDTLMRESDFVSLHAPFTPETHKLVGRHEIELMKRSAFLINTSRGGLVDEQALIQALREGRIAGAGLDVFEKEPPDPSSPLFAMDNVVLSPHMASFTEEGRYRMGMGVVQGVLDVLRGVRPQFLANPEVWDRRRIIAEKE